MKNNSCYGKDLEYCRTVVIDKCFHENYHKDRSKLHDNILTSIFAYSGQPWSNIDEKGHILLLTAGPMATGKSTIVSSLQRNNIIPFNRAPIVIDIDAIRMNLIMANGLSKLDAFTVGENTQKESGYVAELAVFLALSKKENGMNIQKSHVSIHGNNNGVTLVILDGSMREIRWHRQYITTLRSMFPELRVFVIHITAARKTAIARNLLRAETSLRGVPQHVLEDSFQVLYD